MSYSHIVLEKEKNHFVYVLSTYKHKMIQDLIKSIDSGQSLLDCIENLEQNGRIMTDSNLMISDNRPSIFFIMKNKPKRWWNWNWTEYSCYEYIGIDCIKNYMHLIIVLSNNRYKTKTKTKTKLIKIPEHFDLVLKSSIKEK